MVERREQLVQKLTLFEDSDAILSRLVHNKVLSASEAAIIGMRVAALKLDVKVTALLKKTEEWYDAG